MITYDELVRERFHIEAFEWHVGEAAQVALFPEDVKPWIKKSAEKVLKTLWPMMTALPDKNAVKMPWDSPESFQHLLPLTTVKMFYLGMIAKVKGPGEAVGFTKLEEFGAGYLCGDCGCGEGPLQHRAIGESSTGGNADKLRQLGERAQMVCVDTFDREMCLFDVADRATLDERKKYFVNACKACYYAGAAMTDSDRVE